MLHLTPCTASKSAKSVYDSSSHQGNQSSGATCPMSTCIGHRLTGFSNLCISSRYTNIVRGNSITSGELMNQLWTTTSCEFSPFSILNSQSIIIKKYHSRQYFHFVKLLTAWRKFAFVCWSWTACFTSTSRRQVPPHHHHLTHNPPRLLANS